MTLKKAYMGNGVERNSTSEKTPVRESDVVICIKTLETRIS